MSPRRPRGFAATLLGYAGAGLAIGAIGSSAIMLWLLRTPPTISRAELDAWLAREPYVKQGVWKRIDVTPIRIAVRDGRIMP